MLNETNPSICEEHYTSKGFPRLMISDDGGVIILAGGISTCTCEGENIGYPTLWGIVVSGKGDSLTWIYEYFKDYNGDIVLNNEILKSIK